METKNKFTLPLQNEELKNQLEQACRNYSVLEIYYYPKDSSGFEHLYMITDKPKDADQIREKRWVSTAISEAKTKIYVSCYSKAEYQLKKGYPMVHYYCHPSLLIYGGEDRKSLNDSVIAQKKLLKKYQSFQESFFHDHDILLSEAKNFYQLCSPISTYLMYIKLLEHDLNYLEYIFTGVQSNDENLHIRIKNLIPHIPILQKLLVKKNESTYFLILKLESAVRAAESCDEIYIKTEWYSAIQNFEFQLYQIIEQRFDDLKKMLKSERPALPLNAYTSEIKTEDQNLKLAVSVITKIAAPEEIFIFHTAGCNENNTTSVLYYLLVIGEGIGNDKILQIQDAVQKKTDHSVKVVILSHSRIAIQENLFNYQKLMREIMTNATRVYTSDAMHPEIHWEEPYTVEYGDMGLYYKALQGYIAQYYNMRSNIENDNRHGFISVFSNCFMRAMRIFIYGTFHSYMPHHLSTFSIWKLCLLVNPSLEKLEFLFSKINDNFHKLIDNGLKYTDNIDHYAEEKLLIMDEILNVMVNGIEKMIKEKGLQDK